MSMSQLLFSFSGRLNRKPYWLTTLCIVLLLLVVIILVFAIGGAGLCNRRLQRPRASC